MVKLSNIIRITFGALLLFFGLNGFLQFMPMPQMSAEAGSFLGAIASAKFFFPIIALVEIIVGASLLANRFVPLALIVVFPIILCAVLFHIALDPAGLLFALISIILNLVLCYFYKSKYSSLLKND